MREPQPGIPFGAYRLIKRLARGGMAEVFLASQRGPEGFERRVAVKRILPHLVESSDFVAMFLDEARLAARLSHPNIVHIYEFGKFQDYYFIAMEHVDGVDTNQMIIEASGQGLPPEIVARLGADAAAGLHHAHQLADPDGQPLDIVHRDISPQNLLLSYDGVLKIVDFGIAKAAHHAERTRPGVVKGKFAYMSPEQVVGKALDGRSDVYSLAVVMWELLAGRFAYSREAPAAAMREIRDGKLPAIQVVREDVPRPLALALARALQRDREKRPSAAQFALDLESYLKEEKKLATAMVVAEWMKRHWPRPEVSGVSLRPATPRATEVGTAAPQRPGTERIDASIDVPISIAAEGFPSAGMVARLRPGRSSRARRRLVRFTAAVLVLAAAVAVITFDTFDLRPKDKPPAALVTGAPPPPPILVEPAEVPAPEPIPAPAPSLAALEIITNPPGAAVALEGVPLLGTTPLLIPDIEPGDHAVVVSLAGHKAETRRLSLGTGEKYRLELALRETRRVASKRRHTPMQARGAARPSTGFLTVHTVPWSDVFLGGRKLGQSPLAEKEIPAGTHTLVFKGPFGRREKKVTIRPGDTAKLSLDFRAQGK